jgi:beta-mannosidase
LQRKTFDGVERAGRVVTVNVPPRATHTLPLDATLTTEVSPREEVLVATEGNHRAVWFFDEDRHLRFTKAWASATAERTAYGYAVTVTAATLQRDVTLLADKIDANAVVDEGMLTLLPGESATFRWSRSRRRPGALPRAPRAPHHQPARRARAGVRPGCSRR